MQQSLLADPALPLLVWGSVDSVAVRSKVGEALALARVEGFKALREDEGKEPSQDDDHTQNGRPWEDVAMDEPVHQHRCWDDQHGPHPVCVCVCVCVYVCVCVCVCVCMYVMHVCM